MLINVGQHFPKKLPAQYWLMIDRQHFLAKLHVRCCVYQAGTTLQMNTVYALLSKYVWDNIAQENYLHNVVPECADIFLQENRLQLQICVVACLLVGYNITKQPWLFLFNVGLAVYLGFVGQQWTEADIDWNRDTCLLHNLLPNCSVLLFRIMKEWVGGPTVNSLETEPVISSTDKIIEEECVTSKTVEDEERTQTIL